ncbi:MAG TPA: AMP-binding protein [Victivallales bacterium]|nr:AMP-binding protein [Victivallales bacterium]
MNSFDKYTDLAFKNRETIDNIQNKLFQNHLNYCLNNSPYYRNLLKNRDINNLNELPFTDKNQLVKDNDLFIAANKNEIVDISYSSGTTGKPVKIMSTESDLKRLAYNEYKSFQTCDMNKNDTVLITCTMDRCFIAGLAYFSGVRKLGAKAIRNGLNSLESHNLAINDLSPTVIIGVPSFLRRLGKYIHTTGKTKSMERVRKLICIGEPIRKRDFTTLPLGLELSKLWNADIYSTYASSEIASTFCECKYAHGGHLNPDLAIIEIIDKNNNVLPSGNIGEIAVTPLQCTGMPLLRFKTGDISFIDNSQCKCGRNTPRLGPVIGRKQQMLKIYGTTIYPQTIFASLEEISGITEYYIEVVSKNDLSDIVTLHLAVEDKSLTKEFITNKLNAKLRVGINISLEPEQTIKERVFNINSRKPIRFFDNRSKN